MRERVTVLRRRLGASVVRLSRWADRLVLRLVAAIAIAAVLGGTGLHLWLSRTAARAQAPRTAQKNDDQIEQVKPSAFNI
jgi:hypothetical protein